VTWERKTLKELCLQITKRDPASTGRERIRYIDISGVDGTRHRLLEIPEITSSSAPSRCRQVVLTGDTVFSTVRPYLEKIALIDESLDGEFASTGFSVLRPGPRLEPKFLYYFTLSQDMSDQILPYQKGVSYPAVLDREVRSVSVPVPPLEEQRRIVAILEDHFSRLDAAETYLRTAARRSRALVDQLLDTALETVPHSDISFRALLSTGLSNGRSVPTAEVGFPVLRLTALRDRRIDITERKVGAWTASEAERFLVRKGDFLISRGNGSLHLVGRGGLVEVDPDRVAYPDTLIRARPILELLDTTYLSLVWNSPMVRRQIERVARTTAGIYKVNQSDLGSILVPVPAIEDQRRIAASVVSGRGEVSRANDAIALAQLRSAALRRSLLAAAFSGQLTGSSTEVSEVAAMINA
jgi:type I restriction enzyme S subunit